METRDSYQVRLKVFEGPLDLLLFLIKKQKIDINQIPIATITREYMAYLDKKEKINLDREAEFLLMAALLIYIKSQILLPCEPGPEEEEDPRQVLVDRLLEHQKIKALSTILRQRESEEQLRWKRNFSPVKLEEEELQLEEVSLFDLAERFFFLMKRKESEKKHVIKGKQYSLEEKMKEIVELLKKNSSLDFVHYFSTHESLEEALVSFFSLLELLRARVVVALQEQLFDSIKVWLARDH
ncbi:MAG: segregation and condensation protein A [Candidatus Aminicenantales bacterium]